MSYFAIMHDTLYREIRHMFKDTLVQTNCSVSVDFVNMIAHAFPKNLVKDGEVLVGDTLHFLGFRQDINFNEDVYIRDNNNTLNVYKGSFYNGRLRDSLTKQGDAGYQLYNKLFNLFASVEVVQPNDLGEKTFESIQEIGSLREYSK